MMLWRSLWFVLKFTLVSRASHSKPVESRYMEWLAEGGVVSMVPFTGRVF